MCVLARVGYGPSGFLFPKEEREDEVGSRSQWVSRGVG